MRTLSWRLRSRFLELQTYESRLESMRNDIILKNEGLVAREQQLLDASKSLDSRADEVGRVEQGLEALKRALASESAAIDEVRRDLAEQSRQLEEDRRQLELDRGELVASLAEVSARERDVDALTQDSQTREAERVARWQSEMDELRRSRESIAALQSRLESERRLASRGSPHPVHPAVDRTPTDATQSLPVDESIDYWQRVSRDARRRAIGS
jgi:chromosome segregation ATPase